MKICIRYFLSFAFAIQFDNLILSGVVSLLKSEAMYMDAEGFTKPQNDANTYSCKRR